MNLLKKLNCFEHKNFLCSNPFKTLDKHLIKIRKIKENINTSDQF